MGNFVDHINLLPKVTNYGASIFKTIAKESHMDNSIKSHFLIRSTHPSKQSKQLNVTTRGDRPISPSKPLSTSCMSKKALLFG